MNHPADSDEISPVAASIQPDQAQPARAAEQSVIQTLKGLHLLVVDDDPFSLELIEVILRPYGVRVVCCGSAAQAAASFDSELPDLLVTDIAMPGEDGLSLIKRLRTLDSVRGSHTPAIAISGYSRPQDQQRALAAGFQLYLVKPIEPADLVLLIAKLARERKVGPRA